jgi:hypothetical protein
MYLLKRPRIGTHHQQLPQAGKSKTVALVACLHKLLFISNTLIRDAGGVSMAEAAA